MGGGTADDGGAAALRIGTCSWKYPSWAGLVYSAAKGINYLEEYARRYDTVEIDQWFWSLHRPDSVRLPRVQDVAQYRRSVPNGFRFSVKAPNSITLTHFYQQSKSAALEENPHFLSHELTQRFLERLAQLEDVLGPVLLQFEYLNKKKMPSQKRFLDRLGAFAETLPKERRFAVEVRNPRYLNQEYFALLAQYHLAPVLQQGYWMPPIWEIVRKAQTQFSGFDLVVIRLHGPDRKGIEKLTGNRWDRIVAPRDDELEATADLVAELCRHRVSVFVNINNHFEGSAPLTIERFQRILGRRDGG